MQILAIGSANSFLFYSYSKFLMISTLNYKPEVCFIGTLMASPSLKTLSIWEMSLPLDFCARNFFILAFAIVSSFCF